MLTVAADKKGNHPPLLRSIVATFKKIYGLCQYNIQGKVVDFFNSVQLIFTGVTKLVTFLVKLIFFSR